MSNNPLKFVISDTLEADNNANYIDTFIVSNLSDSKSSPGISLENPKHILDTWINGYFGCGGFLLNIADMRADTLGWFPTQIFPVGSWNRDIGDLWVSMVLYSNPLSNNSAKKSNM